MTTPLLTAPGVQDSRRAYADLRAAIDAADSVNECLRLSKISQTLSLELLECVDLALSRADQVSGEQR